MADNPDEVYDDDFDEEEQLEYEQAKELNAQLKEMLKAAEEQK